MRERGNIANMITGRALLDPERDAVVDLATDAHFSYGDLERRARATSAALARRLGVGPGDRVCILARNGIAHLDLLFGLARLGAIHVPLNWRWTSEELGRAVGDCRPRALAYSSEFGDAVASLQRELPIPHTIAIGEGEADVTHAQLVAEPGETWLPETELSQPVCILYTSGTSGKSKGALIPHRQVLWNCLNTISSWDLGSSDATAVFTPMFHAGGLFALAVPLLHAGGRVVLAPEFDPNSSLEVLPRERCTVVLAVPSMLELWLQSPKLATIDTSALRWLVSGGAPCPPRLIERWYEDHGIMVRQGYGMTEAGVNCFAMTDETARAKPGSIGKRMPHVQTRIVDGAGDDVAVGKVGELLIAGPTVCSGYWNDEHATAELLRDGWLHTGDLARTDEDGDTFIAGRAKDMLISGGENVYAAEVEAVVCDYEGVTQAALIARPDPLWGEVGWIAVVGAAGNPLDPEELLDHCRRHLARYKVPKRVVIRTGLPTTAYGKVIKSVLAAEIDALYPNDANADPDERD